MYRSRSIDRSSVSTNTMFGLVDFAVTSRGAGAGADWARGGSEPCDAVATPAARLTAATAASDNRKIRPRISIGRT